MALNIQSLFQTLQLDLTQLDDERIQAKKTMWLKTLYHLPPVLACIVFAIWELNNDSGFIAFLSGIAAFAFLVWWVGRIVAVREAFAKSFKAKVIKKMIAKIDPGFTYLPDNQKHKPNDSNPLVAQINKSMILPEYHTCWTEDVISGTVRDNKFDFMELKMENGRGRQRKIVFQGILLTVHLNSSFPSNIYIYPDQGNQLFTGLLTFLNLQRLPGKAISLNHPQFERVFNVFADDEQTPAAVLTTPVLERLLKIHQKLTEMNGLKDSIYFSFVQNTITIAVKLKINLFEPRLTKPVNDLAYFESNANYLVMFLGLIDDLNVSR